MGLYLSPCETEDFEIESDRCYVTIKNNHYRSLCCGWFESRIVDIGETLPVTGEPELRMDDNCQHTIRDMSGFIKKSQQQLIFDIFDDQPTLS